MTTEIRKTPKTRLICLWALCLTVWASAAAAESGDYSAYTSEVEEGVVLAGSLDLAALRAAHPGTVRVVDLRTEPEGTPEEAASAADLDIEYTNIPVAGARIEPAQVAELRSVLEGVQAGELLVVHCGTGNRAGMLWGAMLLEDGMPLSEVEAEVAGVVTKAPINDALKAYAKSLDAGL